MSEQNHPVENGSREASDEDRILGIVDQVRGDRAMHADQDVRRMLVDRLSDAGISVTDEQVDKLVALVHQPPESTRPTGREGWVEEHAPRDTTEVDPPGGSGSVQR